MTTYTYKHKGTDPVLLTGHGTVEPGKKVTSEEPINHPDFELEVVESDHPIKHIEHKLTKETSSKSDA